MLDSPYRAGLRSAPVTQGQIIATHAFGAPGSVMARPTGVQTDMYASSVAHRVGDNGNNILDNLRIFKIGTFTDMFGFEHTWDEIHVEQMVQHYSLLRDGGYFPNVPVRADHSFSVKDIVGYFDGIYRDPDDDQFLSATIEFTEPDAWEKWERGTWRSRSIEIGMYETNDGRTFWPVVMGLAFVDIPAVEGLHARQKQQFNFSTYVTDKENVHMDEPDINTEPEKWIQAVNYAHWLECANYAQACDNWVKAVNYAAALEQEQASQQGTQQTTQTVVTPAITGAATTSANSSHSTPQPQVMQFRVNGQPTADFARIQSHIDMLEAYRAEAVDSGRKSFVTDLARENKIPATQIESLTAHALTLDDNQFATFRAMYENAPAIPGLGAQFGHQETGDQQQSAANTNTSEPDEIETAKEIVAQHRRAGMTEDKVQATPSYKKLVAAGITL